MTHPLTDGTVLSATAQVALGFNHAGVIDTRTGQPFSVVSH